MRLMVRLVCLALAGVFAVTALSLLWEGSGGAAGLAAVFAAVAFVGYRSLTRRGSWRNDPASERQKEFADELGIAYPPKITKGELSDLISRETGR